MIELEPGRGGGAGGSTAPPDLAGIQVGTYSYLKNFRKGLLHQKDRCLRELAKSRDKATAADLERRFDWIHAKIDALNRRHQMICDKAFVWPDGRERWYGSMEPDAMRPLTDKEIRWNNSLIREEHAAVDRAGPAATALTSGAASASSAPAPAAPAPATAAASGRASASAAAQSATPAARAPAMALLSVTPAAATATAAALHRATNDSPSQRFRAARTTRNGSPRQLVTSKAAPARRTPSRGPAPGPKQRS